MCAPGYHPASAPHTNLEIDLSRSRRDTLLLEALTTEYGATLGRFKRYRRFLAALRTTGPCLHFRIASWSRNPKSRGALGFTSLAALWLVFELLVVEEKLLPGRENEICPAVNTLQDLVLKFHNAPFNPAPSQNPPRKSPKQASASLRIPPKLRFPCFRPWAEAPTRIKPYERTAMTAYEFVLTAPQNCG